MTAQSKAPRPAIPAPSFARTADGTLCPCFACGCLVLVRPDQAPVSAALGEPHDCATATAQWEPIGRYLAGELLGCFVMVEGKEAFRWMEPVEAPEGAEGSVDA